MHWVNHTLTSWKHFFFASSNTQYCAKAMQEKCVNFFFCSCELSRKSEVRVTIWGLLSEISWLQRMLFCCAFGTKQNVTRKSIHSLTQCMKFCVRQTTTFHVIYLIYWSYYIHKIYVRVLTHTLAGVQWRTQRMKITSKIYHEWRLWFYFHSRRDKTYW